jgi:hypothetical protein
MTDNRPDPKPRKNPHLWQAYLFWEELMLMRQRHNLRISSIEKGKSNLDAVYERQMIEGVVKMKMTKTSKNGTVKEIDKDFVTFHLDDTLEAARQMMVYHGTLVPAWSWITGIKGLGAGSQAAKILALIDDIGRFDSVAKLWRYSGYGLYEYYQDDGKVVAPTKGKEKQGEGPDAVIVEVELEPKEGWEITTCRDRGIKGYVLPYNKTLKSALYVMADGFIKQQTPVYIDLYYAEKKRQRSLHPEKIGKDFSDGHINNRAIRRMIKEFTKDLWLQWRTAEGLPVTEAW